MRASAPQCFHSTRSLRNWSGCLREIARDAARLRFPPQDPQGAFRARSVRRQAISGGESAGAACAQGRSAGIPELVQKMKGGAEALTTEVVEAMTTNETFFFRD